MSKTLQRGFVMKKRIIPILTIALSLPCASVCDAYYLLRLKNRGMVTTHAYWFEGNKIHFYVNGGIASLERREIDKIEDLEKEVSDYRQRTAAIQVKKETPSAPSPSTEKGKEAEKVVAQKEEEATAKDDSKKDPKIMGEFKAQQQRFESRKNMTTDELSALKDEMTALRDTIVSSQSEEDYREEISKLTDMRFLLTDLILLGKTKNQ